MTQAPCLAPGHSQDPFWFWSCRDRVADAFGVSPPRLVWGRQVLSANRRRSAARACRRPRTAASSARVEA